MRIVTLLLCFTVLPKLSESQGAGGQNVCITTGYAESCAIDFWIINWFCSNGSYSIYNCCDGWASPGDIHCSTPLCMGAGHTCPNGGTCETPNYCACTDNFYSPNCTQCTQIDNCEDMQYNCTTSTDQRCRRCQYTRGHVTKAYELQDYGRYPDRTCTQLCSWRPDSKQCYPGRCSRSLPTPSTCQCAPGYSSTPSGCMSITEFPEITSCVATGSVKMNGIEQDYFDTDCIDQQNPTTFTRHQGVNHVRMSWTTRYIGPSVADWPLPYYVNEFNVGVIEAKIAWKQIRNGTAQSTGEIDCNTGASRNNPYQALHECNLGQDITVNWQHADVLQMQAISENGGFMEVKNFDDGLPRTGDTQYYSGRTLNHTSTITFDFEPPVHCSVSSTCDRNMLEVGAPFTTQTSVDISWYGWIDSPSNIAYYDIEAYRLSPLGEFLGYAASHPHLNEEHRIHPTEFVTFTFPEPGTYVFLLTITDVAENYQIARRFVLFDNNSTVEISPYEENQIVVNSAAENTSYEWLTNLDESVYISWKGHFLNEEHIYGKYLAAIDDHHIEILPEYEEGVGQPPLKRSTEAIPSVNGTVRHQIAYARDHEGGRSITQLSENWLTDIVNFHEEMHTLDIIREDGDSLRFWIKVWDVMNNTAADYILVHVDSSPPQVILHGLANNQEHFLAVHSTLELYEISLHFDAFDHHSGLREVYWELYDMQNPEIVHGSGQLPASQIDCDSCLPPNCYQIPKDNECYDGYFVLEPNAALFNASIGRHDFDYIMRVRVTNNAQLVTEREFQITIDTSPPIAGAVYDAEPGQRDSDFKSHSTIHAAWSGFFDKESGIKMYKYMFGPSCINFEDLRASALITTNAFASFENQSPGTYHTSVIAYNNAMEPSNIICSDGITIDDSPPTLRHISVEHLTMRPGFVRDANGIVMFVDSNVHSHEVENYQNCRGTASSVEDVCIYKPYITDSRAYEWPNCTEMTEIGQYMFLATENHLNISWEGFDEESGPLSFEVCLGRTSEIDDVLPCSSTNGHQHFITYHPNLRNYETFYIHLKARNRAGIYTSKNLGPIMVRENGAIETDSLQATLLLDNDNREFIGLSWTFGGEYRNDFEHEFLKSVSYAIGKDLCNPQLVSFTTLSESMYQTDLECTWTNPPNCAMIPLRAESISLHYGTSYCIMLRLEGLNEINTYVSTHFNYHNGRPKIGKVLELDNIVSELIIEDIDYQIDSQEIKVFYSNFGGNGLDDTNLVLQAALSTEPIIFEHLTFEPLENLQGTFTFRNLNMNIYQKYVTIIKSEDIATNLYSVSVSDGVVILPDDSYEIGIYVIEGVECLPSTAPLSNEDEDYHTDNIQGVECGVDVDFQSSTTTYDAHWRTPDIDAPYIANQYITLYKQELEGRSVQVNPTINVGVNTKVHIGGLDLQPGASYFTSLTLCHLSGCYQPITTNGVTVLPEPPISRDILETNLADNGGSVRISWLPFVDRYTNTIDFIQHYEMAIYIKHENAETNYIFDWEVLEDITEINGMLRKEVTLENPIHATSCIMIAIKGVSKPGLHSTTYKELAGCEPLNPLKPQVYDAHGSIGSDGLVRDIDFDPTTTLWIEPEREFTPSLTKLSAVWPSLRHGHFYWKVLCSTEIHHWAYYRENMAFDYHTYHCSSREAMACGETQARFINVHNMTLEEGARYYVCVYAPAVTLEHELWNEPLPSVSSCSNGIVVDTHAPIFGQVWIGTENSHRMYQTDSNTLTVQWSGFHDAETYANTKYDTAIYDYTVSIGTERFGVDVINAKDFGLTNYAHLTGLHLDDGRPYYVTVTAIDYCQKPSSVSSPATYIDSTPPVYVDHAIKMSTVFFTSERDITFIWSDAFYDHQSGISVFDWCIGSTPELCDKSDISNTEDTHLTLTLDQLSLVDGHHYYFIIQAINGAGLINTGFSAAFTVDNTPPVSGVVKEVSEFSNEELNYQSYRDTLHITWNHFYDPHVAIRSYTLSVGTCVGCRDILSPVNMGLNTKITLEHLALVEGVHYIATVIACSVADLCTTVTSDGIAIDIMPPHVAQVLDGSKTVDTDYQSSRTKISGSLVDLHDSDSGLKQMAVWYSTETDGVETNLTSVLHEHPHEYFSFDLSSPLPERERIYTNVVVCDNVAHCTKKKSNGFLIDSTAPVVIDDISVSSCGGSINPNTLVWRDTITVSWGMEDNESPIDHVILSLTTDQNTNDPFPRIKLYGEYSNFTFINIDATDGDYLTATVQLCNKAALCSSSSTGLILVDNSPPISGTFAISTTHSMDEFLQESRYAFGLMTYSQSQLHLAWIGFQDPHSGIDHYVLKVGRTYRGTEIVLDEHLAVAHDDSVTRREGHLQNASITVNGYISGHEQLFITVQAINKVGLKSAVLHGLFATIPSGGSQGQLYLVRRCDTETCEGHCTCAPHGLIHCSLGSDSCTQMADDVALAAIDVYDIYPSHVEIAVTNDINFTISAHAIAARWDIETSGRQPLWFEWSVGIDGYDPGINILDTLTQPVWFDNMDATHAVFTVSHSAIEDFTLDAHITYVFYVKAWYSDNQYRIYRTDGVQVDTSPPEKSSSFKVTESLISGGADIDFSTDPSHIYADWSNVFRDSQTGFDRFIVCIGTVTGSCDIQRELIHNGTQSETHLQGLALQKKIIYHTSVTACNQANMCVVAYSDGIMVDITPPDEGIVLDGHGLHDVKFTSDPSFISANWAGFMDDSSYIRAYRYCVVFQPNSDEHLICNETRYQWAIVPLDFPLGHNSRVYFVITAINGVGMVSAPVRSNGILLDLTPPVLISKEELENNLINNPSFESSLGGGFWQSSNDDVTIGENLPYDGLKYACIRNGALTQITSGTTINIPFKLSFAAKRGASQIPLPAATFFVTAGHAHELFVLTDKANANMSFNAEWVYYHLFFTASEENTLLTFGTEEEQISICFDAIELHEIRDVENANETIENGIHMELLTTHESSDLVATWTIEDYETSVVEYLVALGTVEGGVQLSNFESTGHKRFFKKTGLELQHGTPIHVTIKATNGAGLHSIFYSQPLIVDITAPVIDLFQVNGGGYILTIHRILITWQANDEESGIEHCWISGTVDQGVAQAIDVIKVYDEGSLEVDINTQLTHGETLRFLLRCKSTKGLVSSQFSQVITYVQLSPSIVDGTLNIIHSQSTIFPENPSFVANTEQLWVKWADVNDYVPIEHCEIDLSNVTGNAIGWRSIASSDRKFLEINGLSLENNRAYELQLRCENIGGFVSEALRTTFMVDATPPIYTDVDLSYEWLDETTLRLDWNGAFRSTFGHVYQVNAGTVQGGADILKWAETDEPHMVITELIGNIQYFVTINAINKAGLYTSQSFVIG